MNETKPDALSYIRKPTSTLQTKDCTTARTRFDVGFGYVMLAYKNMFQRGKRAVAHFPDLHCSSSTECGSIHSSGIAGRTSQHLLAMLNHGGCSLSSGPSFGKMKLCDIYICRPLLGLRWIMINMNRSSHHCTSANVILKNGNQWLSIGNCRVKP